ncbi:MAG: glycoside hydrolase family 32 protein, partial [Chitinophagaceae bacterium]|nr:glycoside hydrolase family 32 protein [Chitinophagaceae bacterium]
SAVVDSNNTSGLGKAGDPAMVMFFTGARAWGQGLAWTTDGSAFNKYDRTVVNRINKENRDPKVFWHEPSKHWIMVLWVEGQNGLNTMQFLKSTDLKNWAKTSVVKGGISNDRYLFECPDFYELPVDGNPNNKKWILSAANCMYAIGNFDGITFTPEAERLQSMVGRDYYAAQTINNEPSGRRIEIGWWRTHTDTSGMAFNQSMSVPMEMKLITTPQGLRVVRIPVKELESLRQQKIRTGAISMSEKSGNPLKAIHSDLVELRAQLRPGEAKTVVFSLNGLEVVYDVAAEEMSADGIKTKLPLQKGQLQLTIFVDRTGAEIFANNGLFFMPVNKNLSGKDIGISATGGKVSFSQLDVYTLTSAWKSPI